MRTTRMIGAGLTSGLLAVVTALGTAPGAEGAGAARAGASSQVATAASTALTRSNAASTVTDAASAKVVREARFTTDIANGWASVERHRDTNPGFTAETYPPDGRGDHTGQTARFFGAARPASSRFLLYAGPAPTGTPKSPVLLVHGANQTADQAWADPGDGGNFGCGVMFCPSTGLMQRLVAAGHPVYAIGFPHRNGDGYHWAQQVGDAVDLVRAKTKAAKVDVVGWSKGAFNARQYVSSVRKPWGRAYDGRVNRLVLLGNPSRGFDWGHRHGWNHNTAIFPECGGKLNAPAPHSSTTCFGVRVSHPELSYEGAAFPGSGQMLARWDDDYPLPAYEQDWYTTYHGGTGFFTSGRGIQWVIDRQSLVEPILSAGIPGGVPTYLLCGTAPTMAGMHNEHTGPSDGAVFVASCTSTRGIGALGGSATPFLNHLQLGWASTATNQVVRWLS